MPLESPNKATLPKNINESMNQTRESFKLSNFILPKEKQQMMMSHTSFD